MNPNNRPGYTNYDGDGYPDYYGKETIIDTGIQCGLKDAKEIVDYMTDLCIQRCGFNPFAGENVLVNKIQLIKSIREAGRAAEQTFYQEELQRIHREIARLDAARQAIESKLPRA